MALHTLLYAKQTSDLAHRMELSKDLATIEEAYSILISYTDPRSNCPNASTISRLSEEYDLEDGLTKKLFKSFRSSVGNVRASVENWMVEQDKAKLVYKAKKDSLVCPCGRSRSTAGTGTGACTSK